MLNRLVQYMPGCYLSPTSIRILSLPAANAIGPAMNGGWCLDRRLPRLDVIFHVGAWTDVLETDVTKMLRYNFDHSRKWIDLGQLRGVPVIYASTSALYGRSRLCVVNDPACERPLNAYGYSKLLLDRWVQAHLE